MYAQCVLKPRCNGRFEYVKRRNYFIHRDSTRPIEKADGRWALGLSRLRWALLRHFFEFGTLSYVSNTLEHLIDFWGEFEFFFFCFLGQISSHFSRLSIVLHMLNAIFFLWNDFSKPSRIILAWIMNNSTLSPDWLTVVKEMQELWSVGAVDFGWFVTSCFSELLAPFSVLSIRKLRV